MKNNEIWLITSNKNGTSDSGMRIMSMNNNTVYKTEIINNNFIVYANEFGSVEISYDGNKKRSLFNGIKIILLNTGH